MDRRGESEIKKSKVAHDKEDEHRYTDYAREREGQGRRGKN